MQELAPADAGGYTGALPQSAQCHVAGIEWDEFIEVFCSIYGQSWVTQSNASDELVRGDTWTQSVCREPRVKH
eukprot:scaffold301659_cov29-Prasinocladus_malaysianus.AAC.1